MESKAWTEERIAAQTDESAYFERKSGSLLEKEEFRRDLAKAVSAFANSEGGTIAVGVQDDGSFDGVDPLKGRTPIDQWLGQLVENLVAPRVHDIRVTQVQAAAADSKIPTGKVLVTIDLGKSILAPHQSTVDQCYYQRVDKQSVRAQHRYIELLFSRDRFPGPRIAAAWVYSVINPIASAISREVQSLCSQRFIVEISQRISVSTIAPLRDDYMSANAEQFFANNSELRNHIQKHDIVVSSVSSAANVLVNDVTEFVGRTHLYEELTTLPRLKKLKDPSGYPRHSHFSLCTTRDEFIQRLFVHDDVERNSRDLVFLIVNGQAGAERSNQGALWYLYSDEILNLRQTSLLASFDRFAGLVKHATEELEYVHRAFIEERDQLCQRHDLPAEERYERVVPFRSPFSR